MVQFFPAFFRIVFCVCSTDERNSKTFVTSEEWVNEDPILSFGWTFGWTKIGTSQFWDLLLFLAFHNVIFQIQSTLLCVSFICLFCRTLYVCVCRFTIEQIYRTKIHFQMLFSPILFHKSPCHLTPNNTFYSLIHYLYSEVCLFFPKRIF